MKNCLVTGANGHLGFAIVQNLRAAGHRVRASVRDVTNPEKTRCLRDIDGVEVVQLDLFRQDDAREAMKGIDTLFQVAAAYEFVPRVSANEILRASLEGGLTVLRAAAEAGVERLIFTSSCVAVGLAVPGGPRLDESYWNEDLRVPYVRAKTLAERQAWAFAEEHGIKMIAILPGAIGGPFVGRPTPSIDTIRGIRMGSMRLGAPKLNHAYVDVRDVAEAHRLASEVPEASGRYLICNDELPSFYELACQLHEVDGKSPRPMMMLPDAFLPMLPMFDWVGNKVSGTPRVVTRELVGWLAKREWRLDNSRAKRELGWRQGVSLRKSLEDTIASIDMM